MNGMKTHLVLSVAFVIIAIYILTEMVKQGMTSSPTNLAMALLVMAIGGYNIYQVVDDFRKIRKERL